MPVCVVAVEGLISRRGNAGAALGRDCRHKRLALLFLQWFSGRFIAGGTDRMRLPGLVGGEGQPIGGAALVIVILPRRLAGQGYQRLSATAAFCPGFYILPGRFRSGLVGEAATVGEVLRAVRRVNGVLQ